MYLKLSTVCFFFEKIVDVNHNYFNLIDYQIYSIEERQELINSETYELSNFLLIPQIDRNLIMMKFIEEKCNKKLLLHYQKTLYFGKFHDYIEENGLVNTWYAYEKSELVKFASDWCELNYINYTIK